MEMNRIPSIKYQTLDEGDKELDRLGAGGNKGQVDDFTSGITLKRGVLNRLMLQLFNEYVRLWLIYLCLVFVNRLEYSVVD